MGVARGTSGTRTIVQLIHCGTDHLRMSLCFSAFLCRRSLRRAARCRTTRHGLDILLILLRRAVRSPIKQSGHSTSDVSENHSKESSSCLRIRFKSRFCQISLHGHRGMDNVSPRAECFRRLHAVRWGAYLTCNLHEVYKTPRGWIGPILESCIPPGSRSLGNGSSQLCWRYRL